MNTEDQEKLIREIFDSYPEAGGGMALQCTKWDYKNFVFEFVDEETEKKHTINLQMVMEAFPNFIEFVLHGKVKVFESANLYDAGEWDAYAVDALAQYVLFKDVVYG